MVSLCPISPVHFIFPSTSYITKVSERFLRFRLLSSAIARLRKPFSHSLTSNSHKSQRLYISKIQSFAHKPPLNSLRSNSKDRIRIAHRESNSRSSYYPNVETLSWSRAGRCHASSDERCTHATVTPLMLMTKQTTFMPPLLTIPGSNPSNLAIDISTNLHWCA